MIAFVAFNFCCFAYSIFERTQIRESLNNSNIFFPPATVPDLDKKLKPFLNVDIVVIAITQCIITWLSYQLFQEFGWKIYKKIGADPRTKSKRILSTQTDARKDISRVGF